MRSLASLLAMALAALLAACGATTGPLVPPAHLMADCPAPALSVATNGQMAATLNAYRWALAACNDDKAALRAWADDDLPDTSNRP